MSKGLGKVERIVLEALKRRGDSRVPLTVQDIACQVYYGFDCFAGAELCPCNPPNAVYQAICRAVRSLEGKGLVKCERNGKFALGGTYYRDGRRGGSMSVKKIRLINV